MAEEIGCRKEIVLSKVVQGIGYQKPCYWMDGGVGGWVGGLVGGIKKLKNWKKSEKIEKSWKKSFRVGKK